jgi:DNA-binding transcriptional ArsR family regulator
MTKAEPTAPFAYEGLDRIFHEKARLGIVSSLAGHSEGLAFSELKALCGLTDGNLSRHLQVLEEAGKTAAYSLPPHRSRPRPLRRLSGRARAGAPQGIAGGERDRRRKAPPNAPARMTPFLNGDFAMQSSLCLTHLGITAPSACGGLQP